MAKDLIGSFYFKKTSSNNLIGEFFNDTDRSIITESANLISSSNGYLGRFKTSWIEASGVKNAELVISVAANSNNSIFQLKWTAGGQPIFEGEGFLVEDLLVGYYYNV